MLAICRLYLWGKYILNTVNLKLNKKYITIMAFKF